jgi:hypothetical protein
MHRPAYPDQEIGREFSRCWSKTVTKFLARNEPCLNISVFSLMDHTTFALVFLATARKSPTPAREIW